ncbi:zinc finger BED domain-containing protein 5 [Trichonephila clavipes]|uniref:Zinc finger BED domain-containing protein 5 n=1 Tax=Trichonephila clavipes TaxID=2585209 RepID=A0A8X6V047_TRICX|nr:zinc finger BED domain-containing protein 5 [Trichonephila clavipes]
MEATHDKLARTDEVAWERVTLFGGVKRRIHQIPSVVNNNRADVKITVVTLGTGDLPSILNIICYMEMDHQQSLKLKNYVWRQFCQRVAVHTLSNDTVSRRIDDIAEDVEQQLFGKLRDKLFSIQLDEATDSNKDAHFIEYVRFWDEEENLPEAEKFRDGLLLMKLSYLVDKFEKLNILNLQLQGSNLHMFDTRDKINAFCRKLQFWSRNLKQKNPEMLENADKCVKTYKIEEHNVEVVYKIIEYHLAMLAKNFKKYFFAEDNLIASYEWVRDPFQNTPEGFSTTEEESFIDFTSSGEIKRQFCKKTLFQFWAEVDEFSELKTKAFRILLPFSTIVPL